MWIVMTSSAKMPSSCWGRYRNVYVAELKCSWDYPEHNRPEHIRSTKIARVRNLGHFNVGSTDRSAYAKAVATAEQLAYDLNNLADDADADAVYFASWGGSA